jgi:hypothetical protein
VNITGSTKGGIFGTAAIAARLDSGVKD